MTPATQQKSSNLTDKDTPPLTSNGPFQTSTSNSGSPAWLARYTEHLEAQATGIVGEPTDRQPRAAIAVDHPAARSKDTVTPRKVGAGFRVFNDEATLQAKRHGGRRPFMLTPSAMAKKAGGIFMLSPTRMSVSPSVVPLADSTNRHDNVTPPNANRPRLHKKSKKVKTARKLEEIGLFDKENIAPQMAYRGSMSSREPGVIIV